MQLINNVSLLWLSLIFSSIDYYESTRISSVSKATPCVSQMRRARNNASRQKMSTLKIKSGKQYTQHNAFAQKQVIGIVIILFDSIISITVVRLPDNF